MKGAEGVTIDPAAGRLYWASAGARISYANLNRTGGGDATRRWGDAEQSAYTPALLHGGSGAGAPVSTRPRRKRSFIDPGWWLVDREKRLPSYPWSSAGLRGASRGCKSGPGVIACLVGA